MNALARLAMLGVLMSASTSFAVLRAQDAKVLVEQLGHVNERAAARTQLLAMGADAVPALAGVVADALDAQLIEVLAILTELGPAAGAAVPQLVARAKDKKKPPTRILELIATIAELAPWCEGDAAPDWRLVLPVLSMACMDRSAQLSTDAFSANERLYVRSSLARDSSTEELIALVGGRRAYHRELAIELLGRRGSAAQAALPALARVLSLPEPRVLLTERTVPLHAKAARAVLAIAPDSDVAALAGDVLAGKQPATRASQPALPERTRARIAELVQELDAPETRAAAVANLVAFGALAAEPVAGALTAASIDTQRAAIAVLRELGPGVVAVLPQILTAMRSLPADNLLDAFDIVLVATPRSADVVPLGTDTMPNGVRMCERWVTGLESEAVQRFAWTAKEYHAARRVDAGGTHREFGEWLNNPCPFVRERALIAAAQRGEAVRPLLARIGEMLSSKHPPALGDVPGQTDVDRTEHVQRAAARAIVAIAPPGDPLIARAEAVLARPERPK